VAVTKDMLVSELQNLLRLTAFEQTIATVRRAQAASTPIAEELKANAAKSVERSALLKDAVRQVGGVPDVVGAAMGKLGAFVQTQLNQVQTLQGALLGDLALEHQLRERTRYARTLAESLGYNQVLPVLDRLETAHTATIDWLETRLAEVGRTGTSALEATPVQAAVGTVRKVVGAPFGLLAAGVNRGTSLLRRGGATAVDAAEGGAEQVLDVASLDEDHPPFAGYGSLSGDSVMRHVRDSDDVEHLREILAYEQAHKNRKGVVQALEERLTELSGATASA
jgi:bacterioferritin (cytochrome b1)